ncbi:hypothetical protein PG997_009186 [Apiospora hydei]|uniref:Uncharacterized protein n=1 Tax=Apiospora hydei TaxID=1337664 RepID=A0ABR1VXH2_9PEZI
MRSQTPLLVVASLLSVAFGGPVADPRSQAGAINSNNLAVRMAEPEPPFVKGGGGRGTGFPPDTMPPPFAPGQGGGGGGHPPKGHKPPHGDGGNPPESHTATWPPAPAPTLDGTDSGSTDETP